MSDYKLNTVQEARVIYLAWVMGAEVESVYHGSDDGWGRHASYKESLSVGDTEEYILHQLFNKNHMYPDDARRAFKLEQITYRLKPKETANENL